MSFNSLFAIPTGRTPRGAFVGGLIVLLVVYAFYFQFVKGRNGEWCMVALLFPAFVLHARRLHDMGKSAWLLLAPGALAGAAVWVRLIHPTPALEAPVIWATLLVVAAFAVWGLVGKAEAGANAYGAPEAA